MSDKPGDVTIALRDAQSGVDGAAERLAALVYDELRKLAAGQLRKERRAHLQNPTELAHEAWLRFSPALPEQDIESRKHLFGIMLNALRRILVDQARARQAEKRGRDADHVPIDSIDIATISEISDERLIALDEALTRLEQIRPRVAETIKLQFFGGCTQDQIAAMQGVTRRTVVRDWAFGQAWLRGQLQNERAAAPPPAAPAARS